MIGPLRSAPSDILPTYAQVADAFAQQRAQTLFEAPMLAQIRRHAPGPRLLDLGCGTGRPLATWLERKGFRVTGVDGAAPMLRHFRRSTLGARAVHRDMRKLDLRERFDAILAWNSFFHLTLVDQARMFPVFARHARPGAVLVFSSGPCRGIAEGAVDGKPVFHASHDPLVYRRLLRDAGFDVIRFLAPDPRVDFHNWWLCRKA